MAILSTKQLSQLIKEKAIELGFDLCGIAPSRSLQEYEPVIRNWCESGMNGEMSYLGSNIRKRIDPGILFPDAKSVIVTGLNYYTEDRQEGKETPIISKYAYGTDYHQVIIAKLNRILDYIKSINPASKGRSFVDFASVLEKAWGKEAGLGWPGKHSILINDKIGSFFFLGIIILNSELEYDKPFSKDLCGNCRLCIDLCPTGAINENRTIDARKCISYLTVESKRPVPEELAVKMERKVFGCDRCQENCPWNKNARQHSVPEFELSEELKKLTLDKWVNLSEEQFDRLFKGSPIERRKFNHFKKNVTIVTNSPG